LVEPYLGQIDEVLLSLINLTLIPKFSTVIFNSINVSKAPEKEVEIVLRKVKELGYLKD